MKHVLLIILVCATLVPAFGQLREGDVLDKIVAVVGKEIVLRSEIDGQLYMLAQQNKEINPADAKLRTRVLDALINDRLMYNKALEDSIQVSDDEVNQQLDATIAQLTSQFGSTERLEQVYQMPLWKIKRDGREEIKKRVLMERIRASKIMDVKVTRAEVEEFYKQYKDSLPEVSQQLELFHIVKFITPSTSTKDGALALAKRVRDSLLAGSDFCQLVKNHSKDPGTLTSCGDLGMIPCNSLVPEFCNAAKKLQPNEVSLPIETPFGYHIIQLIERTKDQIHTRHILIGVPRQDNDVEVAKKYLLGIKEQVEQGKISFEEAAKNYSEEKETQGFGGAIGKAQLSTLDPSLKTQLEAMSDGGITEPLQYQADRTKPALHIVFRKRTLPAHKPTIETDYKDLERVAQSFKQNKEYEKWIATLRRELHWEVRQ